MKCIKCGREHQDYHFKVLQVQTLHVRDFGKNSRIQALGDFEEYDVCIGCTKENYARHRNIGSAIRKCALIYGTLVLLGVVLAAAFWNGEGVFRLFGLGLAVGGGLCLYSGLQNVTATKKKLEALPEDKALFACAWECLVDHAPRKNDVNDITYIPVNEETLARKNGDLMILFDLLPEIAVQAHKRLHGVEDAAEETEE